MGDLNKTQFYVGVSHSGRSRIISTRLVPTPRNFPGFEFFMGPFGSYETAVMGADAAREEARLRGLSPRKNPGVAWHKRRIDDLIVSQLHSPRSDKSYLSGMIGAHRESLVESHRLGINPPKSDIEIIYDKVEALYFEDDNGEQIKVSVRGSGPLIGNSDGSITICNVHLSERSRFWEMRLARVEAQKGSNSLWSREKFGHDFKHADTFDLSGTALTVSSSDGKKLWKKFNYD